MLWGGAVVGDDRADQAQTAGDNGYDDASLMHLPKTGQALLADDFRVVESSDVEVHVAGDARYAAFTGVLVAL